jgi:S1-C subfamily serine protease
VKEFLSREGIKYQEKNVQLDRAAAQEMVNRSGQTGVPVTVIAEQVIVGFDQPRLKSAVERLRQQAKTAANTIKLGAKVANAGQVLGQAENQNQTQAQAGAILGTVQPGSLAAQAGLREGDIITAVNQQVITNVNDLAKALQNIAQAQLKHPQVKFWRNNELLDTYLPV